MPLVQRLPARRAAQSKGKFRRHPNKISKLLDLIVALNERRKYLEEKITELEIMQECGGNIWAAQDERKRLEFISRRADMEQTGI